MSLLAGVVPQSLDLNIAPVQTQNRLEGVTSDRRSLRITLGRQAARRYPRLTATALAIGYVVRTVLLIALVLFLVGGLFAALGGALEYLQKSGWTLKTAGLVILGLLFALLEWIGSWPGYVWLLLIAVLIAFKITSQLEYLAGRIRRLEHRVVALTKVIKKERGGGSDFDDEDEW
jgi:hypothetical protein